MLLSLFTKAIRHIKLLISSALLLLGSSFGHSYNINKVPAISPTVTPVIIPTATPKTIYKISNPTPIRVVTPKPTTTRQTPGNEMPDKPIIESFCDNKGNCVHSQFADPNSNSSLYPYPTVHSGDTLNFSVKVSGQETSGVLGFIIDQDYKGGEVPWTTNLTYSKTFSSSDITTSGFPIYAYIKSQNDNYHRTGTCNWTGDACDDSATLNYTVLP
jgi:hypothetical protein